MRHLRTTLGLALGIATIGMAGCASELHYPDESSEGDDDAVLGSSLQAITVKSVADLPVCADGNEQQGVVYYVAREAKLYACVDRTWTALVMPAGATGRAGSDALIASLPLARGSERCPEGGLQLQYGTDRNGDRALQASEVLGSDALCTSQAGGISLPRSAPLRTIAAGGHSTCVRLSGGRLACWGELQGGTASSTPALRTYPDVTSVSVGRRRACAVGSVSAQRTPGYVSCWGSGRGDWSTSAFPAKAVASGNEHSCALQTNGSVSCWGDNVYGQLGAIGAATGDNVRVLLDGIATQLAAGGDNTCAVMHTGGVSCWGRWNRQSNQPQLVRAVPGLFGVQAVSVGENHACALLATGEVACWGANGSYQLGVSSPSASDLPVLVSGLAGVTAIAAGSAHTCALLETGSVVCWGANGLAQLGTTDLRSASPGARLVPGVSQATSIAAGESHSCAQLKSGDVMCWGDNARGQLGRSTAASPQTAQLVSFPFNDPRFETLAPDAQ